MGTFEDMFFKSPRLRELLTFEDGRVEKRHIRLYLDGLDEVPNKQRQSELMAIIKKGIEQHQSLQVVLTARDHVCGASLAWLARVRLSELDEEQKRDLIERWLENGDARAEFVKQLSAVPSIATAMAIPLLATLTLAVYKNTRQLPSSKFRLYSMFVELLCGGWDLVKNVQREHRFGPAVKQTILVRLSAIMHEERSRECGESQVRLAIRGTLTALVDEWKAMLDEMLDDGLLVRVGNKFAFAHLSFQEFLASRDLGDPSGGKQERVLRRYLGGDDWPKEVLAFFVAGADNPQYIETWLVTYAGRGNRATSVERGSRVEYLQSILSMSHPHFVPRPVGFKGGRLVLGEPPASSAPHERTDVN